MRRHFRPAQVYETATALIESGRISEPQWYNVVGSLPPTQALVRTQPLPHQRRKAPKGTKKASKLFQPQRIAYEEDSLRAEFFKDHPWELARPRMILENDGRDSHHTDWSRLGQSRTALNGESVIQRQLFLMRQNKSMTRSQAYDQARKELYESRLQEDVERRIAKEEALATGARFGKSALEIGMQLESKEYESWRQWATSEVERAKLRRGSSYTSVEPQEENPDHDLESLPLTDQDSIPELEEIDQIADTSNAPPS